jgi:uncharacterized protein
MTQAPFVWYDLMTTDVKAAETFYSSVVGWTTADSGVPGMDYTMLKAGGVDVAGVMGMPPNAAGMPPMWNGYVYSSDVDADCARATKLGGSILQPGMDIPGTGRFAVIADPSGAALSLFTPSTDAAPPATPPGTPGHTGWHELHTADLKQAWDFYAAMFGWTKGDALNMGALGDYQMFRLAEHDIGGIMKKQDMLPVPMWLYYFNVESINAAVKRLVAGGGKVAMEPHQVPGGSWIVSAFDPQGASFQLVSNTQ